MKDKRICKKVTGEMLTQLVEEVLRDAVSERDPLPFKDEEVFQPETVRANSLRDLPKAWDSDEVNVVFELDNFDWRSEEEIFRDQVAEKWRQFQESLSQREQAVLRSLLGLDVKRYSIDELQKLQNALKGK